MNISFIKTKFFLFSLLFFSFPFLSQSYSHIQQVDSLINAADKIYKEINENEKFLLICKRALKIAQSGKYEDGIAASYYQISRYYSRIYNDEKMFSNILSAEKHAEKSTNNYLKANIASYKALCYNHYHQYKEADKNYKKAILLAQKIENHDLKHLTLSKIYSNLSNNLDEMGASIKEIIEYDKKALEEDLQLTIIDNYNLSASYSNLGINHITMNDYKTAEKYYQKAIIHAKKDNNKLMVARILGMMAEIELYKKNYQKAIELYQIGLPFNDPDILEQSYLGLAATYDSLKNTEKSNLYYAKYGKLKDSLAAVEKNKIKITLDHIEKENQNKVIKKEKTYNYLLLCFLVGFFGLGLLYVFKIKQARKKTEIHHQKETSLDEKQYPNNTNEAFAEMLELAKNNDPAFLSRFQELYPEYCKNLKTYLPDITQNELHFCGFLKLKLSTKDIAEYQFVTPKAIQNRKNKLRKRLNIDPKIDLYDYLDGFN